MSPSPKHSVREHILIIIIIIIEITIWPYRWIRIVTRYILTLILYVMIATASGNAVDATQELYCLGVCNLLGSFVSSMPVTGSFSRSAVNHASGVRTPMGGMYTGNKYKYIIFRFKNRNRFFTFFSNVRLL